MGTYLKIISTNPVSSYPATTIGMRVLRVPEIQIRGFYHTLNSGTEVSDGAHGAPRVGAENAGAWTAVTKWRKTA